MATSENNSRFLVSISCITFNHASFLRQCLDSFLMQKTNFEFEIVINDDCSTDGTIEILNEYKNKYPKKINLQIQKENQWSQGVRGITARFNLPRCTGKYVALCEGDDYWTDENKLQKQVDILENDDTIVLVGHDAIVINENNETMAATKLPEERKRDCSSIELK